ncbi:XRE family transcriptional regulator [Rhodospirillales bacterium 47_12_T64]|nr:XRE family transcriptional regulator [Rhodospirillales bacterium 47_12_T64]
MDKRDRSIIFRERLMSAMEKQKFSRSKLARETRVDRSTIGQLLRDDVSRLPNAQLAADVATVLGVSTDWLLGLTNRPERPGDIVAAAMALSPAERSSADAQLLGWHREAAGYKVRHVPATLPDILKSERMLDWEYSSLRDEASAQAINAMNEQRTWLRSGVSDYEIALPLHELKACAEGTGYYEGLTQEIRYEQLQLIADLCGEMFPRLRLFLFNAHQVFSAPVTVFGPNLAVVYIGQFYLAFRESQRVHSLANHFDWLVREASVDARNITDHINALIKK